MLFNNVMCIESIIILFYCFQAVTIAIKFTTINEPSIVAI